MIKRVIFDEEIVLYWDRQSEWTKEYFYKISYALETIYTKKTHFTIKKTDFTGDEIEVTIALVREDGEVVKTLAENEKLAFAKRKNRIDVTGAPYFAVGDGKTLNTAALQRAIDDCGANDCVYIPAGVFLTGALNLHSDMELFVSENATLQGSQKARDYLPKIKSRFEGIEKECCRSLLNIGEMNHTAGYGAKNIIVRGGGSILGGGRALMIDTIETESGEDFQGDDLECRKRQKGWYERGRLLQACNCENIVVANLTIGLGASWNLHFIYSKNILTFGCQIVSTNVNNGDGWDIDSSEDCTLFDCDFDTRDDMVAIKSGKNPEGNIINRPSRNIQVFDCRCERGHGLAVGSEMSGGVENVCVWDCQMENSRCGLEIKGVKERGGFVKNIRVYDSAFSILAVRSVDYNNGDQKAPNPPVFENFYFENITLTGVCLKHTGECWNESAIILEGFDEYGYALKGVTLKDIMVKRREDAPKQALTLYCLQGVKMENICCE